ncbi:hypothetical protein [Sinorhizobium meliloti]|nr:hypothetical protein [Sinorhizobium meliloti]RVK93387.1 hypothetical protein CN152_23280 [Sinorhizobium meliloti]RVN47465.1 hypothetical protein CN113_12920 [Sinorhizobium meliloti]
MSAEKMMSAIDLRDFLRASGWSLLQEGLRHRLYVLSNPSYPKRQLVFPMDTNAPDYEEAINRVLHKFGELTNQTVASLISAVSNLRDDVLKLRVFFEGNDRTLPLPFASTLVTNAEKMLKSGACTVLQPRTSHPKLSLTEAVQFVEHARFGQTEEGSFILNFSFPLNAMDTQGKLPLDDDIHVPFVRQVTLNLEKAISELVEAIEADTLDALVDGLKTSQMPLISANLCDALAGMHDEQVNNAIDLTFNWSSLRQHPRAMRSLPLRIQSDYFSRIEEVHRALKAVDEDEEDTFIGTVEKLEGVMGSDGKRSGGVVLALLLPEGEIVRARTMLDADDYAKAGEAHMRNGSYVRVTGKLRQGRQPRQFVDMTSFEVLSGGATAGN